MPRPESTLTTLGSGKTPLTHISAARQAFEAAQQARAWWLERTRYTVTVSFEDRLWEPVLRWFAQHDAGEEPPRAVAARLRYRDSGGGPMPSDAARNRRKAEIELLYDVKEERKITVSGHQVAVSLKRPAADSDSSSYPREPDSLRFATRSVAAHRAVLAFLNEIVTNTAAPQRSTCSPPGATGYVAMTCPRDHSTPSSSQTGKWNASPKISTRS